MDHLPVLTSEVVDYLITDPNGAYLDLTSGLGGHLKALASTLEPGARLYGIDLDRAALKIATERLSEIPQKTELVTGSYREIDRIAGQFEDNQFHGVLLDLGLSSLQLDNPERGFSFMHDGPLDMRFDPDSTRRTAADLINSLSEGELVEIIRDYSEEKHAARLARTIVRERQDRMIGTTAHLSEIVRNTIKGPHQNKSLARIFQALRIAVNGELDNLKAVLPKIVDLLHIGGRVVVLSYHSLEDRLVKEFFRQEAKGCICPPNLPQCVCGRTPTLKLINRKVIVPQPAEAESNPRARTAKMRVAERIAS
jgi:16S rRNA (cytosine1402-N4)-methyltransferase